MKRVDERKESRKGPAIPDRPKSRVVMKLSRA
jgi:hypothetical protein